MARTASPSRAGHLFTALGALAVVALIGALPFALVWAAGNPLDGISTWFATLSSDPGAALTTLWQTLTSRDDGDVFLQTLAIVGWVAAALAAWAWASFLVAFVIELVAQARARRQGRVAHHAKPIRGMKMQQRAAAVLAAAVIGAVAAPTLASASITMPPTIGQPAAASATQHVTADTDAGTQRAAAARPAAPTASSGYLDHEVQRGEGLLDIAEQYGVSLQRLADANHGVSQPDGRSLQPSNTRIYAGWTLRVPITAVAAPSTAPTAAAPSAKSDAPLVYEVARGDNLSHIAERFLDDADRYPEIARQNPTLEDRDERFPEHIEATWKITLPDDARDSGVREHATGRASSPTAAKDKADAAPPRQQTPHEAAPATKESTTAPPSATAPTTAAPQAAPTVTAPAQPAAPAPADTDATAPAGAGQHASAADNDDDVVAPIAAAVAGLGLLASLSLLALRRRRARQQQHRRPRRRITQPAAGGTEAKLRVAAAPNDLDRLDAGLRTLAAGLTERPDEQWPDVVAAWMEPDAIHLVLTEACTGAAPTPWRSDGATIWTLPAQAPLPEIGDQLAPLPTLVALGSQSDQQLLVDLERLGMLTVAGDPERALDLLRYIAGELAHNVWSDEVHLTLAGFDPDEAALLAQLNPHRVTVAASIEDAVATLRRRLDETLSALSAAGASNTVVGRGTDSGEAWPPHVLLIAGPTDQQQTLLAALEEDLVAASSTGFAVVVTGADQMPGRRPVSVTADGQLTVAFLTDTPLTASALPAAMLQPLVDLLSTAEVTEDQPTPPAPDTEAWAAGTDAAGGLHEPEPVGGMDDMFGSDDDAEDEQQPNAPDTEPTVTVTAPVPMPSRPASAVTSWQVAPTESTLHTLYPSMTDVEPQVAQQRRREREKRDPHLDSDLAAWIAGDTTRPRIGILGPVQIAAPGRQPKDRHRFYGEFIVYLASRGARGSTAAQLEDAIWREQKASSNSRRQAISNARAWLGAAPGGTLWMPHMADKMYHLTDGYLFDWVLFRRLRARGEARGADGAADLRAALELVRGAPFDGVQDAYTAERTPYAWLPDSEIAPTHLVAAIVDTAHQLVDLSLAADDRPGARWAVDQAWLADPERNEDQPWRDAMRLAHAEGRDAEFKALLNDLMRHRDAECDEDLDPHTYRLVRQLMPYPNRLAS